MKRIFFLILLALAPLHTFAGERLSVVVSEIEPCVNVSDTGQLSGFSIDLWAAVARQMGVEYDITHKPFEEKMSLITNGNADVAIGCISATSQRQRIMEFSMPVANGGLLAVSTTDESTFPAFSKQSKKMLLVLLCLVVAFAHLMWWSEKGKNTINDRYFPGIFEAIWFSVVTMSTVGYGDIAPKRWLGKISALLIILTGVTAFGVIFGQFASDAVSEEAGYTVTSVQDLRAYKVAVGTGSAAESYLKSNGVKVQSFNRMSEAYSQLTKGKVQLIVHDAVAMRVLVQRHKELAIASPVMNHHFYSFAMKNDSRWRKSIDEAILNLRENGLYDVIRDRWL